MLFVFSHVGSQCCTCCSPTDSLPIRDQVGEHVLAEGDAKEFQDVLDVPHITLFNAQAQTGPARECDAASADLRAVLLGECSVGSRAPVVLAAVPLSPPRTAAHFCNSVPYMTQRDVCQTMEAVDEQATIRILSHDSASVMWTQAAPDLRPLRARHARVSPPPPLHPSQDAGTPQSVASSLRNPFCARRVSQPPAPPLPSRTNWTRLVPPSLVTGHVSSLLPY